MTISNIVLRTLKTTVKILEKEKIDYCLFGGLAMQVYKHIRATKDVDLLAAIGSNDIPGLIARFEASGLRLDKKRGIIKLEEARLLRFFYTDADTGFDIFVDIVAAGAEFHQQVIKRKARADFLGIPVNVASLEDIILLKILADRPIDNTDAVFLIEENIGAIDRNYLEARAKKLGVAKELKKLMKENA